MKIAFTLLTIFVAHSHQQQYQHHMVLDPWLSPIWLPSDNKYLQDHDNGFLNHFNKLEEESRLELMSKNLLMDEENRFPNFDQLRNIRFGYQRPLTADPKQNGRFFNLVSPSVLRRFLKTTTQTVSSTCTDITFVTCVPRRYFPPALNPCRRRRRMDYANLFDDDNSQFAIVPSQIQLVEPTTKLTRDSRQMQLSDIVSSKEERPIDEANNNVQVEKWLRKARYFYLWQNFVTGTTLTNWITLSSTKTVSLIPTDANAATVILPCLPVGYQVCP